MNRIAGLPTPAPPPNAQRIARYVNPASGVLVQVPLRGDSVPPFALANTDRALCLVDVAFGDRIVEHCHPLEAARAIIAGGLAKSVPTVLLAAVVREYDAVKLIRDAAVQEIADHYPTPHF